METEKMYPNYSSSIHLNTLFDALFFKPFQAEDPQLLVKRCPIRKRINSWSQNAQRSVQNYFFFEISCGTVSDILKQTPTNTAAVTSVDTPAGAVEWISIKKIPEKTLGEIQGVNTKNFKMNFRKNPGRTLKTLKSLNEIKGKILWKNPRDKFTKISGGNSRRNPSETINYRELWKRFLGVFWKKSWIHLNRVSELIFRRDSWRISRRNMGWMAQQQLEISRWNLGRH